MQPYSSVHMEFIKAMPELRENNKRDYKDHDLRFNSETQNNLFSCDAAEKNLPTEH